MRNAKAVEPRAGRLVAMLEDSPREEKAEQTIPSSVREGASALEYDVHELGRSLALLPVSDGWGAGSARDGIAALRAPVGEDEGSAPTPRPARATGLAGLSCQHQGGHDV